jgi:hypothetical protein
VHVSYQCLMNRNGPLTFRCAHDAPPRESHYAQERNPGEGDESNEGCPRHQYAPHPTTKSDAQRTIVLPSLNTGELEVDIVYDAREREGQVEEGSAARPCRVCASGASPGNASFPAATPSLFSTDTRAFENHGDPGTKAAAIGSVFARGQSKEGQENKNPFVCCAALSTRGHTPSFRPAGKHPGRPERPPRSPRNMTTTPTDSSLSLLSRPSLS